MYHDRGASGQGKRRRKKEDGTSEIMGILHLRCPVATFESQGTGRKKSLRPARRRSIMAWMRGGAGSKAHSRGGRGSVQRGSIPHAPPAGRGGWSTIHARRSMRDRSLIVRRQEVAGVLMHLIVKGDDSSRPAAVRGGRYFLRGSSASRPTMALIARSVYGQFDRGHLRREWNLNRGHPPGVAQPAIPARIRRGR